MSFSRCKCLQCSCHRMLMGVQCAIQGEAKRSPAEPNIRIQSSKSVADCLTKNSYKEEKW